MSPEQTMWAIKASKSKANKALKVIICHKKKTIACTVYAAKYADIC